MTLHESASAIVELLDKNPDAFWPHGTENIEALREALAKPVAWRYSHEGRWVYTSRDPRLILSDVVPQALYA